MINCFYWSKIQNLKANHNSNCSRLRRIPIAFTGQRYKIWKQITTICGHSLTPRKLLLLVKDTKFESKSQPEASNELGCFHCFYWSKIQNLKANHNPEASFTHGRAIAFTGQRYKIWKQITTMWHRPVVNRLLLLLVKDTKFESKSQQQRFRHLCLLIAFTGQRYKIWKQITTEGNEWSWQDILLLLVKDTKFESKSQQRSVRSSASVNCFYWSKIQNLKANHN